MRMRMQRGPSEESEGRGAAKGRAQKNGIAFIVALAAFRCAAQAAPKSIARCDGRPARLKSAQEAEP
jgi:hypothetical protein